jgi:hypothetical protein
MREPWQILFFQKSLVTSLLFLGGTEHYISKLLKFQIVTKDFYTSLTVNTVAHVYAG